MMARKKENGYKKYFGPFHEIVDECKQIKAPFYWNYIDLFYCRITKQSGKKGENLKICICKKDDVLNDFGEAQLALSLDVIRKIQPKVIWVANAFASDKIFEKLNPDWDDERGTHTIDIVRKTPILFSSMISGGHLDKYSFKRLKWILERISKEPKP